VKVRPTPKNGSARIEEIPAAAPMPADLAEPALTENAGKVLANRYLKKDPKTGTVVETPRQLFWRVASAVAAPEYQADPARGEEWARRFYNLMATGTFMPNSPTLMNAGREMGMLSACFVLPVEDSIDGIFETLKNVALIQKAGGGTGFSFSRLRPDGDIVATSGGTTSGPLSFIDTYSAGTDAIQQGAFRRGANMGVLHCQHPDVVEFVRAKDDLSRWTNYNVSVAVTDDWMKLAAQKPGERVVVTNPRNRCNAWLKKADGGRRISEADYEGFEKNRPDPECGYWTYGEVLELILAHAWKNGEPGLLFIDRANASNPVPNLGDYEATNPCGEQWLLPYSSCNLGSINLGAFFKNGASGGAPWEEKIDWDAFDEVVAETTRFLDDVVTINRFPIPQIRERADQERRVGLGVMGFADLLYKLGVRYGSDESFEIGRALSKRLTDVATRTSEKMVAGGERPAFLAWEGSRPEKGGRPPRRNATLTTVAPTGTISIIAGCSAGIEPLFSLAFKRQVMKDAEGKPVVMKEVHQDFRRYLEEAGYSEKEIEGVVGRVLEEGTLTHTNLPGSLKEVFVTAHDVVPHDHILMQAAWQTHIDNAVSKTINLPSDATIDDVRTAYQLAFESGCKGITVYRDGCRDMQPMALTGKAGKALAAPAVPTAPLEIKPAALPEVMPCVRVRQMTPFGNMHVKISVDPHTEREMEVFAQLGRAGDIANSDLEGICRLLSLFLRCGGTLDLALKQLQGIGSSLTVPSKEGRIMSLPDGVAKALHKYMHAKAKFGLRAILLGEVDSEALVADGNGKSALGSSFGKARLGSGVSGAFKVKCPNPSCSEVLVFEEGCCKCYSCGFSQC